MAVNAPHDDAGLSSAEASLLLRKVGPNEVGAQNGHARLSLAPLFRNPLVLILLGAAIASAALGDRVNASLIVALILTGFVLETFQSFRSQNAVSRLQSTVAPKATVRRDGTWQEIKRRQVVPGDIVRLAAGDLVPADGTLLEEKDLHVNEAALTGESAPVEKEVGTGDDQERVFLGTSVVSGTAILKVEKTGAQTTFGDIAARLAVRAPDTEFERGLKQFGALILRVVLLLVGFALIALIVLRRPPLQSLLFAVALAVGLTPEFLPMITTLTLSRGAVRMARHKVIVKNLASIQNFGSMDILCSDKTGTLTSGDMVLDRVVGPDGTPSEEVGRWASLNAKYESGIASSLDASILAKIPVEEGWTKVDEVPFDFERRRLSVVVEKDGRRVLVSKGSPEGIESCCHGLDRRDEIAAKLGNDGYRVLAVAIRDVPVRRTYGTADETDLQLVGYLAFIDPPLPDALDVIHRLRGAGVDLKVITGDSEAVAAHVCREIGIEPGQIVKGSEIDRLGDDALPAVAERTMLFARVSPAQKNRIILALKSRGHVVGYMGDGINDAPSLHTADVGISFAGATDVAKDAAQIILVERNLSLLHKAILEGRMAFGNVMKYLLMGTSSNFGNMFSMAGAALYLPFLPMLPTQILLNNLMYDLSQVTIPTDRVDSSYMRKPKHWDLKLIRDFMVYVGPISSLYDFLTFWVLLSIFRAGQAEFHTGWFIESLATQTLVIFVIRTRFLPWRSRPSTALMVTTAFIVVLGSLIPYTPLGPVLGFVPLPAAFFLFLVLATLTYLILVQVVKRWLFGRYAI